MTDHSLRFTGVPAVAVRLGRALEGWGRRAARPIDRDDLLLRRQLERETVLAMAARERLQRAARAHLPG